MNKDDYIRCSNKRKVEPRCPLLDLCERRAITIFKFSYSEESYKFNNYNDLLRYFNEVGKGFEESKVNISGEAPQFYKTQDVLNFKHMCPEVSLFDNSHSFMGLDNLAISSANFDVKLVTMGNAEFRHYTECLEYSRFKRRENTDNKNIEKRSSSCYVYLMHDIDYGHYKIGISKSPEFREKTLLAQKPNIKTIKHILFQTRLEARRFESELHKRYTNLKVRGEWFSFTKNILDNLIKEFEMIYEQNTKSKEKK